VLEAEEGWRKLEEEVSVVRGSRSFLRDLGRGWNIPPSDNFFKISREKSLRERLQDRLTGFSFRLGARFQF
jgi:hypothetical protein